jgi:hypothetical protein
MTHPIIKKLRTPAARTISARAGRILVPAALALALLTAGCDKCGNFPGWGGAKSCHDESQLK